MELESSQLRKRGKYKINEKDHSSSYIRLICQFNLDISKVSGNFWNPRWYYLQW